MQTILGYTNGIFDGQVYTDRTIKSRAEARLVGEAILNKYSNLVITAKFKTTISGLKVGHLISIKDTTSSNRNINQTFVIQSVKMKNIETNENEFRVKASSLLFGMIELLQQLLKQGRKLEVDEDARVDNIQDELETLIITDVLDTTVGGEIHAETLTISDAIVSSVITPPYKWQPSVTNPAIWNRFQWS